jgi:uncharacterized protein YegJ (DUF2314 family)
MKYLFLLGTLFITVSVIGQTKIDKNVKYEAIPLKKNDAGFLRLMDTAQKHMPQLLDLLKKHGADFANYRFVVKSDFAEGDEHEHMWSQIIGYANGSFKAIFIDSPFTVKNVKNGDRVTIKKETVEDWAAFKNNTRIAGDFSDKYLNSKQ